MANKDDFGILASDIMFYFNPSFATDGFTFENIETGTGGVGALNSYTVSTANWKVDQWVNWYLKVGSSLYKITANTATVLTISGTPSGSSYSITNPNYTVSATQLSTLVQRCVNEVKSQIPERYRNMIAKITGEIIVKRAAQGQTSATLGIATDDTSGVNVWVNPVDWTNRDLNEALVNGTHFTVSSVDSKTITFTSALGKNDCVIAEYTHAFATVPQLLKKLAIYKVVLELINSFYIFQNQELTNAKLIRDEYKEMITGLADGSFGVSEFDEIELVEETRGDKSAGSLFGSMYAGGRNWIDGNWSAK